jgi:dipeptidyl aminopeptidase/acylaminoacyl peptidase
MGMTREMKTVQSYGSWPTPITSALVVRASVRLGEVAVDGADVWWSELRPEEGACTQIVCCRGGERASAPRVDILPEGFSARTAVHEYGGGAWWVRDGVVWFANWSDQRLYRLDTRIGGTPEPVTPEPEIPCGIRWADGGVASSAGRQWLVAVRETHPDGHGSGVRNELVLLDGAGEGPARVIVSGPDFVSDPRISPDGTALCWMQWNHPDMPWDGSELLVAPLALDGSSSDAVIGRPVRIAGRETGGRLEVGESVFQPRWAADGSLWFVSDRTGWWNLYRWTPGDAGTGSAPAGASSQAERPSGHVEPMVQIEGEIGVPQWVFRQSRYAFLDDGRVVFAYQRDGVDHLAVRLPDGTLRDVDLPYASLAGVEARGDEVILVGGSPTAEPAVLRLRLDDAVIAGHAGPAPPAEELRPPRELNLDEAWIATPEPISFPSSHGRTAHGLLYPPTNPDSEGPPGEKPPLLVLIHGGPTGAARPMFQVTTQYWTSRGFAVVDVNYGGSTGYGRAYRDQLHGAWGVVDVDDCEAAARWLAEQGRVDPDRLCIRGGSAGGYTTLAALAFRRTFAAGASHYGVCDLEALARDTHKFESRYLDGLIGPYPEARDVYIQRSPVRHVDGFDRPLAVFQGLEDPIVPPSQAQMIVDALRQRGVPVAYVTFEGEQHGFRQPANIRRALDGELSFYAQVFGFGLPGDEGIEPIHVENL